MSISCALGPWDEVVDMEEWDGESREGVCSLRVRRAALGGGCQ